MQRSKLGRSRKLHSMKSMAGTSFHKVYTKKKEWGNNNHTKRLVYTALLRVILDNGAVCWNPYREGQVSTLNQVQKRVAKFSNNKNESGWETLAQHRLIAQICALFKA